MPAEGERVTAPGAAAVEYFGQGAASPYERALRQAGGSIQLISVDDARMPQPIDVTAFLADADAEDIDALQRTCGPILDVGCGPGRIVSAGACLGRATLGVDISAHSLAIARSKGAMVLRRSIFDRVPRTGHWGAVVLFDGNIGIGGDPVGLLRRCSSLVEHAGSILVETHRDPSRNARFRARLLDEVGSSLSFPWAEVGDAALPALAQDSGLVVASRWAVLSGRRFALLEHPGAAQLGPHCTIRASKEHS